MRTLSKVPMSLTALGAVGMALSLASAASADVYTIRIENQIPGGGDTGQPMTPPVAVVHDAGYSLFAPGASASAGLELLAEEGMTADLIAEAEGSGNTFDVVMGSAAPFVDFVEFEVEGNPGDLFSVVTMLARSNDLITGVHDIELPGAGMVMYETNIYDAGTEENTGLAAHIPFYGNNFVGPDEDVVISMIASYTVLDDPTHGELHWKFPPSAKVTVTAPDPSPVEKATWGQIKNLYR